MDQPRNVLALDLFSHLTDLEQLLILNGAETRYLPSCTAHRALFETLDYLRSCAGYPSLNPPVPAHREWPSAIPHYSCIPRLDGHSMEQVHTHHDIHIRGGENLRSDDNVYLHGPLVLGKNITIQKGAVIIGPAVIGDGVTIGQGCRVEHAVIRSGARIEFSTRVACSMVGRNVFIGAHTIICDRQPNGEPFPLDGVPLGARAPHLGAFIGDDAFISPGCILDAGAIIFPNRVLDVGAHVRTSI